MPTLISCGGPSSVLPWSPFSPTESFAVEIMDYDAVVPLTSALPNDVFISKEISRMTDFHCFLLAFPLGCVPFAWLRNECLSLPLLSGQQRSQNCPQMESAAASLELAHVVHRVIMSSLPIYESGYSFSTECCTDQDFQYHC